MKMRNCSQFIDFGLGGTQRCVCVEVVMNMRDCSQFIDFGLAPSSNHCGLGQPLLGGVHIVLAFHCVDAHMVGF